MNQLKRYHMKTKISIVIAVYNGAKTLDRCIQSILNQTYKDYDILISDGASSDGTVEILKKHSQDIFFWESKPDDGIADAWNNALTHTRSEWTLFIGADDYLHDEKVLENAVYELDKNKDADIVHGNLILRYENYDLQLGENFNKNKFKRRMTIPHTAAFHNNLLFEEYGNYDTNYKISLDYEFLLRKKELQVIYFDQLITIMSTEGISSNLLYASLKECRKAQIKNKINNRLIIEIYYLLYLLKIWKNKL